jgi:hypothetical protein
MCILVETYDDMMYSRRDYMRLMCILASSRRDFMWVCVFFYGGA